MTRQTPPAAPTNEAQLQALLDAGLRNTNVRQGLAAFHQARQLVPGPAVATYGTTRSSASTNS